MLDSGDGGWEGVTVVVVVVLLAVMSSLVAAMGVATTHSYWGQFASSSSKWHAQRGGAALARVWSPQLDRNLVTNETGWTTTRQE